MIKISLTYPVPYLDGMVVVCVCVYARTCTYVKLFPSQPRGRGMSVHTYKRTLHTHVSGGKTHIHAGKGGWERGIA